MEKYEVNKKLSFFEDQVKGLENALNPLELTKKQEELSKQMQDPNFWSNPSIAQNITKRANEITEKLSQFKEIEKSYQSLLDWFEISDEGSEEWDLLETEISSLEAIIDNFEIEVMLNQPYDNKNVILEVHSGAGGTESQDWAAMLYRMYLRYAQKKGYKTETIDYQDGEEAGIKNATIVISGPFAYGYLKAERGIHRLVRISPFDSNAKRHTSFASIAVTPQIDDDVSVDILDEDIKIDVYRSSGAGGQSVNTTDSAVRITHLKTGIVVTCQNERSQIKNRETAMNILKSRLLLEEHKRQEEELSNIKGEKKDIAWGSQIRSYVFHPYQMVKDHRTNFEVSNVESVMDGNLAGFINAYLKEYSRDH